LDHNIVYSAFAFKNIKISRFVLSFFLQTTSQHQDEADAVKYDRKVFDQEIDFEPATHLYSVNLQEKKLTGEMEKKTKGNLIKQGKGGKARKSHQKPRQF